MGRRGGEGTFVPAFEFVPDRRALRQGGKEIQLLESRETAHGGVTLMYSRVWKARGSCVPDAPGDVPHARGQYRSGQAELGYDRILFECTC